MRDKTDLPPGSGRLVTLDLARTLALIGMVVFHFTLDLELFGHLTQGTIFQPGWQVFARLIAGSFLFLSGFSLFLAHGQSLDVPKFLRRLLVLAGAAALVTLGTYVMLPDAYIFYGILHSIAVASVIGLAFLRLPAWITALAAVLVLATAEYVNLPVFNHPWLQWVGLGTQMPTTMDFEPVFPWLAPFLLGLATAKAMMFRGGLVRLQRMEQGAGPMARRLTWPGRHSLAIYLCHQPILFGVLTLLAKLRS